MREKYGGEKQLHMNVVGSVLDVVDLATGATDRSAETRV
jgi:hypothetical protein